MKFKSLTSSLHQSQELSKIGVTQPKPIPPQCVWYQHEIEIVAPGRGCHSITNDVLEVAGNDISAIQVGMCNVFVQHTTASLSISEYDRKLANDMETAMSMVVPETWSQNGTFTHLEEGTDDMPAHVKSSLLGVSLNIPIKNGQLALRKWQCIYLHEHREAGGWGDGNCRSILITIQGQSK